LAHFLITQMVCREAALWRQLDHPHVLPFQGVDRVTFPSCYAMVSPWMENGSIRDFIRSRTCTQKQINKLVGILMIHQTLPRDSLHCPKLLDSATGLAYLHDEDIIHGDFRAVRLSSSQSKARPHRFSYQANILVNDRGEACVADFGLSTVSCVTASATTIGQSNTRWLPKELLDGSQKSPTKSSDIYAFAHVCVEVSWTNRHLSMTK
jgi:serine/threonine protein kinase